VRGEPKTIGSVDVRHIYAMQRSYEASLSEIESLKVQY